MKTSVLRKAITFFLLVLLILTFLTAAASGEMNAEEIASVLREVKARGAEDAAAASELFRGVKDLDQKEIVTDAEDQYDLGRWYYDYADEPVNAFEWWMRSAEQGSALSQFTVAQCYYFGEGTEIDFGKAAQCYLGDLYYLGEGVEQDYEKAAEWLAKAAEQGHLEAMNNLGDSYRFGEGVEQDEEKAVELYLVCAEQGVATSMFNLGECYEFGQGVEQSIEKAVEWYAKAAELGDEDAAEALNRLQ